MKTYVEVELLGLPRDAKRKHRTKLTSTANSINPVWKEEAFVFEKVTTFDSNLGRESVKLLMPMSTALGEVSASRRPGFGHSQVTSKQQYPIQLCINISQNRQGVAGNGSGNNRHPKSPLCDALFRLINFENFQHQKRAGFLWLNCQSETAKLEQ